MGAFIAGLSNIYVSGQKLKDAKMQKKLVFWLVLCLGALYLFVAHTYMIKIVAMKQRNQFEVFRLTADTVHTPYLLKSTKQLNIRTTVEHYSSQD